MCTMHIHYVYRILTHISHTQLPNISHMLIHKYSKYSTMAIAVKRKRIPGAFSMVLYILTVYSVNFGTCIWEMGFLTIPALTKRCFSQEIQFHFIFVHIFWVIFLHSFAPKWLLCYEWTHNSPFQRFEYKRKNKTQAKPYCFAELLYIVNLCVWTLLSCLQNNVERRTTKHGNANDEKKYLILNWKHAHHTANV